MSFLSHRTPTLDLRRVLNKTLVWSSLLAALLTASVFADEVANVTKLLRAGQYVDALNKAEAFLVQSPRDAQMRFLKGVILTEQNRTADAIMIFTKLTDDFPDMPEPYNNLAVLYASSGQYDKARAALDMAIRTNPTYATAYENLGDVHAKLASQAYDKALQLDSGNTGTKSKLTLLRTMAGNITGGTNPKVAAAPSMSAIAKSATAVTAPATVPVVPAPVAIVKPVSVKPDPAPEVKPAPKPGSNDNDQQEVLDAVKNWAKAWSDQDMKDYLNAYAQDFQTPNGESRKAWADDRRSRIEGKSRISVKIDSPQVAVNGNTAIVKFRQTYLSNRLTAKSRKTLVLTKQHGKWQIKQERTGN